MLLNDLSWINLMMRILLAYQAEWFLIFMCNTDEVDFLLSVYQAVLIEKSFQLWYTIY